MLLFSEIYSCYFNAAAKILGHAPMSEKEAEELIRENAFNDSPLYILPKLKNEKAWGLIKKKGSLLYSVLKNKPVMPVTLLQKRWLRSMCDDKRAGLFFSDEVLWELKNKLKDVRPLFDDRYFRYFDRNSDADNYEDELYRANFKVILKAVREKRVVNISFSSGKGERISHNYLPYRIEYSPKDDKFRIYAAQMSDNKTVKLWTINLSRITKITETDRFYRVQPDMKRIFSSRKCSCPVTVEVSRERNAVERFMTEFAGFEKHTEYDECTGRCNVILWYDKNDITEIIIRLLAYGPVIKVTGPAVIRDEIKRRVEMQYSYMNESI
ncbi:MAG: WYL domain-containing protein [Oscillospiraceae bacterium]|nr:WYL domain-containing protein [Oscillospiraceae bacterium]